MKDKKNHWLVDLYHRSINGLAIITYADPISGKTKETVNDVI